MSRFEKLSQENNKPKAEASEEIFMTKSEIEALREEAEQIERELEEDPFIDSMDPPKELYNRIVQELKDKGIYHEDEEDVNEEKEEVVEEKKKVVFYSRWKRAGKCAAIVCLILSGVFGVAMTSEANRAYVIQKVEALFANDVNIIINNNKDSRQSNLSEMEARETIIEELEVEVPRLMYVPKGMHYINYQMDKSSGIAIMQYLYEDEVLSFYISNNEKEKAEFSTYDGKLIESIEIEKANLEIEIWEIFDKNDNFSSYMAQWEHKNCYYELAGKVDKDNFIEIIKKITY